MRLGVGVPDDGGGTRRAARYVTIATTAVPAARRATRLRAETGVPASTGEDESAFVAAAVHRPSRRGRAHGPWTNGTAKTLTNATAIPSGASTRWW